jgi:uncharacterized protein (DUF1800 family)
MLLPLPEKLWNRYAAAHLLNRAGFGGTPAEIEALYSRGMDGAVEHLLNAPNDEDLFPRPPMMEPAKRVEYQKHLKNAPTEEERVKVRKAFFSDERAEILALRLWWLNRMRYTTDPLLEKVTLFWHGHFATSNQKVNDPYLMWLQNETLRQHALGKFPVMLKAMSQDPAMIRCLDLNQSSKQHPNENFAREVMELFSLGEGHYSEMDVTEAARAFTGYRVTPETAAFHMVPNAHDTGMKTFLGKTGAFTGDQILDLIVLQPQCARFIGKRLWQFFVAESPNDETISEVADILMNNGYDVAKTLRVIFRSSLFYSQAVVHHQIKGPVQWMIQTTRMLEIPLPDAKVLENSMTALGQVLFAPPNVKGWDGGRAWISASSLLYRYNLAAYLLSGKAHILGGGGTKTAQLPLENIAPPSTRESCNLLLEPLAFRIFNVPISTRDFATYMNYINKQTPPYSDNAVRDLMQIMMGTPEFQLN